MAEAAASAAPPAPTLLQPGQVLGNYEVVKPLGKGKFSVVYMAKRLTDSFMCALKKINIFDMMVPKQRDKCMKEVKLLQSLDHPNIVGFLESFIDNNELLIIVEWAERGDLKRLIRRAMQNSLQFKQSEIWEYSRQLSSALAHMHGKRIMHRDLKPANIFVARDASLKLGDLGLGRFFSSQTLEAFSKVGTPLYMSPEVLKGAGYDMRSDVWSLGCVLYELAMLRSPFKSDEQLSLYDLFVRINKGLYPPLSAESTSVEFRALVGQMLQLSPVQRLDCSEVVEICNQHLTGSAANQASEKYSESRRSRPSPLLVMDDIVEKLKLLECEESFLKPRGYPMLHRCFFVQPLVLLPGRPTQFEVMHELMRWLLQKLEARAGCPAAQAAQQLGNGEAASSSSRASDLAKSLAADLRQCHVSLSDTALAHLKQGHGEDVCLILNELINQELVARDFHFEPPSWLQDGDASMGVIDADNVSEASSLGSQHELEPSEHGSEDACAEDIPGTCLHEPVHEAPLVDAAAWKLELERVTPLLRLPHDCGSGGGWQYTFSKAKEYCCKSSDPDVHAAIHDGIRQWRRRWNEELDRVQSCEGSINATFAGPAAELARIRDAVASEGETITSLRCTVDTLSEELSTTMEKLLRIQNDMQAQSESAHDTSHVSQLRAAVKRMQEETQSLAVHVEIAQTELLNRRRLSAERCPNFVDCEAV